MFVIDLVCLIGHGAHYTTSQYHSMKMIGLNYSVQDNTFYELTWVELILHHLLWNSKKQ